MSLIEDASLIQIPSGYKEGKLYSIKPTNGDGDFTFTRASSATRVNAEGLIEEVPYNLFQQSNAFDTTWTKSGGAIITSGQSGYDNTNDAWKIAPSTSVAPHYIFQNIINIGVRTISIYAKGGGYNYFSMRDNTSYAKFDLDLGVSATNGAGAISSTINSVGDGWYKCTFTYTKSVDGNVVFYINNTYDYVDSFAGNGTSGVYFQDAQLNSGSTAKTYFPTTDRLNVPRLDYSGGASCASLLLEPQRSNLYTYSSDFSNAAWIKQTATITANAAISPDGTTNADLYTTSTELYDFVRQNITYISGNSYTVSVFVKQGTSSEVFLLLPSQAFGSNHSANFDVSDGTYTITSGSPSVTIEDYGNGWYRCALSAIATITATRSTGFSSVASGAVTTLYFYGAQVEVGSYPTSYIPSNSGSTTTRTADACNGAGTSATFNDSEGVLFAEISAFADDGTARRIYINNSDNSKNIVLEFSSTIGQIRAVLFNGSIQADLRTTSYNQIDNNKIAFKYKENDFALWVNGVEVDTEPSGTTFNNGDLERILFSYVSSVYFYGKTKQLQYYDSALTDSELEQLTSWTSFNEMATALNYTII